MSRSIRPRYVVDASVAAKWVTRHQEADREKALAVRDLHLAGRCLLVVPEFALLEVLNAVRYSERVEETDAVRALDFLERLRLGIVPLDGALLRGTISAAWEYGIALYDAAYVALAEREDCPLLTADEAMMRKMKGHGGVIRLRDLDLN